MIIKLKEENALPDQLYISVDASTKEVFQKIARSHRIDAWERFNTSVSLLKN